MTDIPQNRHVLRLTHFTKRCTKLFARVAIIVNQISLPHELSQNNKGIMKILKAIMSSHDRHN
jgi:hypothetical protein